MPPQKPHLIYIDHGSNILRHGLLTERRRWTFDVSPREIHQDGLRYSSRYRVCVDCHLVHRATDHQIVCIECGTPLPDFAEPPKEIAPSVPRRTGTLPPNISALWTSAQAAQYLSVSEATLDSWRRKRIGPPWIKMNVSGAVRYKPVDVMAYARSRTFGD